MCIPGHSESRLFISKKLCGAQTHQVGNYVQCVRVIGSEHLSRTILLFCTDRYGLVSTK
jgi:hypothetical protein